jgi:hypothetical protein
MQQPLHMRLTVPNVNAVQAVRCKKIGTHTHEARGSRIRMIFDGAWSSFRHHRSQPITTAMYTRTLQGHAQQQQQQLQQQQQQTRQHPVAAAAAAAEQQQQQQHSSNETARSGTAARRRVLGAKKVPGSAMGPECRRRGSLSELG